MLQNETNTKLPNKRIGYFQEFCVCNWKDRKNLIHKTQKCFVGLDIKKQIIKWLTIMRIN